MQVVFLTSLVIALAGRFANIDFGIIGFLSWIVVLGGFGFFIVGIIAEISGK